MSEDRSQSSVINLVTPDARELLEEERHRLMHEYGQGAYRDGAIRDRIARIDQLLAG